MSHHLDLIGIPFPKDHPLFKNEEKLLKKIFQIESMVEIRHDLDDVLGIISATLKLMENEALSIHLSGGIFGLVPSALGQSALTLYARCFNESGGRTRLDPVAVFTEKSALESHKKFHSIRNKFISHQASNANKHYLFIIPSVNKNPIRLNTGGQTSRLHFHHAIDWMEFISITRHAINYIDKHTDELCSAVVASLSQKQTDAINCMNVHESRQEHFESIKENRNNPFESRTNK